MGHHPLNKADEPPWPVEHLLFPCGACMGCRLTKKREWVIRATHEMQMHDKTAFVTLTYAPEYLPAGGTLSPRDLSLFLKRYRFELSKYGRKVRYLACGEYGDKTLRPHYHLLLFGGFPPDATLSRTRDGVDLYKSDILSNAWNLGLIDLSLAESHKVPKYIAGYITKKAIGVDQQKYQRVDPCTGEIYEVHPEFQRQSTKPGLGESWYAKYGDHSHKLDSIVLAGREVPMPRYYDRLLEKKDPDRLDMIKETRVRNAETRKAAQPLEYTLPRFSTKERTALFNYQLTRDKRKI